MVSPSFLVSLGQGLKLGLVNNGTFGEKVGIMKKRPLSLILLLLVTVFFLSPGVVFAAADYPEITQLADVFVGVLRLAVAIAGLGAFAYFLVGGFKYLTAGGDDKNIMEAKQTLTYAVIGLILVVCSYLIIQLISQMTYGDPGKLLEFNVPSFN